MRHSPAPAIQPSVIKATEPALFVSIYLHRQRPQDTDPREAILRKAETFVDLFKLQVPPLDPAGESRALYRRISEIDLRRVDSLRGLHALLFEANARFDGQPGVEYETVIYSHHDTIIIQLMLARARSWQGTLKEGWRELCTELRCGFGESIPAEVENVLFGVSALYWVTAGDEVSLESYEPDIRSLWGTSVRRTETDLGPLRHFEQPFFADIPNHQDLWVLTTHRDAEAGVNERYYQLSGGPPAFGQVALARHKIFFELAQYRLMRKAMEDRGKVLDRETLGFLVQQRRLGRKLDELVSDAAVHFEEKLTQATNRLAGYRRRLGRAQELRRTLEVNRRNYALQCLRLISQQKYAKVARSRDRLFAATEVLDGLPKDEIFSSDLGAVAQHCQQVDTDLGYSVSVADRHTQALRSASEQLRIAGEREIAEMARHMAVDSAAVVASVAALVVIELAEKRHYDTLKEILKATVDKSEVLSIPFFHALEGWLLVSSIILLVYGLTHAFGSRLRGEKPGHKSIVAGFGLLLGWAGTMFIFDWRKLEVTVLPHSFPKEWVLYVLLPALAGAAIAHLVYQTTWNWLRKRRRLRLAS